MAATGVAAKRVEAGARSGASPGMRPEPPAASPRATSPQSTSPQGSSLEADKRRQILEGARRVFLSAGFDGASMGEVARAAGVSKGTLYVYFDSKEALFEALTVQERSDLAEALFQLDADDPDMRGVLSRIGHTFIDHLVRPDHVASVRMVIGASEKFPRFGQAFYEAGPLQGAARLKAYLDAQVAAGRLAPGHDTEVAAWHFLDLCSSRVLKRLLFAVPGAIGEAERTGAVEAALRVFFAAYGTLPGRA